MQNTRMELLSEINIPRDTEGIFTTSVVEQTLHKLPLEHAIRSLVKSCVFGQASSACKDSAVNICRCQTSSPVPTRPRNHMRPSIDVHLCDLT